MLELAKLLQPYQLAFQIPGDIYRLLALTFPVTSVSSSNFQPFQVLLWTYCSMLQ